MPTYIYGCPTKEHERKEVVHKLIECDTKVVTCECGEEMKRVPQSMRFYNSPFEVLTDWADDNWRRKKAGKPAVNKYKVMRPTPMPQRDFAHR